MSWMGSLWGWIKMETEWDAVIEWDERYKTS